MRSFRPNRPEHYQVSANRATITRQLDFAGRILAKAYNALDTERIQTKGKPRAPGCAWPAQLQELSDIVTGNYADVERQAVYSTNDMKEAWKICEIYGSLPFISLEKRMTLRKVRGKIAWRKLANEFGLSSGYVAREIHDKILMELLGRAASKFPEQYAKPDFPYYQDKEWPKPTQECTEGDPWAFLPVKPA